MLLLQDGSPWRCVGMVRECCETELLKNIITIHRHKYILQNQLNNEVCRQKSFRK